MTETTSSTNTTPAGVVAHALHALADHIDRHQLPTPAEFQLDDARRIEIHLSGYDAAPWWTSLQRPGCVDKVTVEPAVEGSAVEWVTIQGRLPDTGVRVQLQWIRRRNVAPVAAVSA